MALNKILLSDGVTELANVKSVTFHEAVNSGVDLRPGCVGSASIEVEVYNTQPNAVAAGDIVYYKQIAIGGAETLIGEFVAQPSIETKNSYKFVAYDNAQKLNTDFSAWLQANQASFPMTVYALVSAACTVAGVTLSSASWPLSTQNVNAFYAAGITCRDVLSYAAELACKFVRCNSSGEIVFDWYATASNKRIYPSSGTSGGETRYAYKQDGLTYANYTTAALDGVAVHPSGEDDVAYIYPTAAIGNILNIKDNLLLTAADAAFYNAAAQQIYTALSALGSYRPMTAQMFPAENPFRAGDIVAITDSQSVSFTSVVMEQVVSNTAAILSSTGNEEYGEATDTQKMLTQLASDVVQINKLKVDWAEINTAIVNYLTANNVTAQNLTIVDEYGTVLATFDANGITIGQIGETHAEIDFNSFELYDADGNTYLSVGDLRGSNGKAEITDEIVLDIARSSVTVDYLIDSLIEVTVDGNPVTCTFNNYQITLPSTYPAGSVVVAQYYTENAVYHYDLGTRLSGSSIAPNTANLGRRSRVTGSSASVCGGATNTASGSASFVGGGANNQATGRYSVVVGGMLNKAGSKGYATVGGGRSNTASGEDSTVSGGKSNTASNNYATVGGGHDNTASGQSSTIGGGGNNTASDVCAAVGGGQYNTASADNSAVPGGYHNEASGNNSVAMGIYSQATGAAQTVFGKYNSPDATMAEIVGNGTADNARSNARTLDWSGNETLAGALAVGDAATTRVNLGIAFASGDSFSTSYSWMLNGIVTSDAKQLVFDAELPKMISGVSVSVSSLKGNVRGVNGYVDGSSNPEWTGSAYTTTVTKLDGYRIRFTINKSTAFSNAANNTPVAFWGSFSLSFS